MSGDEFAAAGGTDLGSRTDWLEQVTRKAVTNVHNVAIAGGYDSTNFRVSANFRDAEGILKNSGFNQFNISDAGLFGTPEMTDKVGFNASDDAIQGEIRSDVEAAIANVFTVLRARANLNPGGALEKLFGGYFEASGLFDSFNPVSILQQNINNGERTEFNYGLNLDYSFSDNFSATVNIANQSSVYANEEYYAPTSLFRGNATSPIS